MVPMTKRATDAQIEEVERETRRAVYRLLESWNVSDERLLALSQLEFACKHELAVRFALHMAERTAGAQS